MAETTKQELLQRAVELMGREELARRLKVPGHLLDAWLQGQASMPDGKLMMLAVILDASAANPLRR